MARRISSRRGPMANKRIEEVFEQGLFRSRWLMAPFYVGLVIALILLLLTFGKELVEEPSKVFTMDLHQHTVVLWLLTLIGREHARHLTLMVELAGYQHFRERMDLQG